MGLLDEVSSEQRTGGRTSHVDLLLSDMGDKDATELHDVLMNFRLSDGAIGRALRNRGHNITDAAIGNWRRKYRGAR